MYWWSTKQSAIQVATKRDNFTKAVVTRPGQVVTDLVVSRAEDLFWIETGPDGSGGNSCRILGFEHNGLEAKLLYAPAPAKNATLRHLVYGQNQLRAVSDGNLVSVDLRAPVNSSSIVIGITPDGLASDGATLFYTYVSSTPGLNSIIALTAPPRAVALELNTARNLAVDETQIFFVQGTPDAGTSRISAVPKTAAKAQGDAIAMLSVGEENPIALAIHRSGPNASAVVWANAGTGAIRRRDLGKGGTTTTVATATSPNAIAVDDDGVYWSSADGVTRLSP